MQSSCNPLLRYSFNETFCAFGGHRIRGCARAGTSADMNNGSKRCRSRFVRRCLRGALAAAITLAVTGCATLDNRTPQERAADQAIVRRIEAALIADPYLDADHVTVEVSGGVARLSGFVGDDMDLKSVLRICWAVPGVRSVDDQLEIFDFGEPGGAEGPAQ